MSYVVLARKWRPKRFAEMVGQEHVLRALLAVNQQRRPLESAGGEACAVELDRDQAPHVLDAQVAVCASAQAGDRLDQREGPRRSAGRRFWAIAQQAKECCNKPWLAQPERRRKAFECVI